MIIDSVIARGLQIAITAGESGMISLVEKVEFQFTRAETVEALLSEESQLVPENRARSFGNQRPVGFDVIANNERSARLPRQDAQGVEVGPQGEVAKTGIPARDLESIQGIHL